MQCNHIAQLKNPRAVFLLKQEEDENPSEEAHHSYYIASTPSDEEENEYLSDEVLSEGDFDDEQWK